MRKIPSPFFRYTVRQATAAALFAALLSTTVFSPPAWADASLEALQRKIIELDTRNAALQHRIEGLERALHSIPSREAGAELPSPVSPPSAAGDANPHLNTPIRNASGDARADRALERSLVRSGALLLLPGQGEIQPSIAYTHEHASMPVFLNDNGTTIIASQLRRRDVVDGNLLLRLGLPHDAQIEFGLPYRYTRQQTVTAVEGTPVLAASEHAAGGRDIQVGIAKTLLREHLWRPDLVARMSWDRNWGDADGHAAALGISAYSGLTGSLTATWRQDPLVFLVGMSYQYLFEKDNVRPGADKTLSLGVILAASPETSLRWVLDQSFADDGSVNGERLAGSNQTAGTLTIGASSIVGRGLFVDIAVLAGLTEGSADYSVIFSFSKRFDLPTASH